jgi:hypothetical protein
MSVPGNDGKSAGSMRNSKAPAVKTHYDLLDAGDSQNEYYKLKIQQLRMEKAQSSLSAEEKQAMNLASDLDVLTCKILVKLKILPDFHPELNTMRAITGMESREDIARELAVKHYNKAVVDRFVKKYVSVEGVNTVLNNQQSGIRSAIGRGLNLTGGGLDEAWTGSADFATGTWAPLGALVDRVVPGAGGGAPAGGGA